VVHVKLAQDFGHCVTGSVSSSVSSFQRRLANFLIWFKLSDERKYEIVGGLGTWEWGRGDPGFTVGVVVRQT